jgi:hypothetical protein
MLIHGEREREVLVESMLAADCPITPVAVEVASWTLESVCCCS